MLHPSILRRKFAASLVGMEVDDGKVDQVAADVYLEEAFREHFADAVRETDDNLLDEPDKRALSPALAPQGETPAAPDAPTDTPTPEGTR